MEESASWQSYLESMASLRKAQLKRAQGMGIYLRLLYNHESMNNSQ